MSNPENRDFEAENANTESEYQPDHFSQANESESSGQQADEQQPSYGAYENVFRDPQTAGSWQDGATEVFPEVNESGQVDQPVAPDLQSDQSAEADIAGQRAMLAEQQQRLAAQQEEIEERRRAYLQEQEELMARQADLERQQAKIAQERAEEAARLEAEAAERLEEQRAERDRMLGTVRPVEPQVFAEAPVTVVKRNTDGFAGSLGLCLLRVVLAGILGIRGYQYLVDVAHFREFFEAQIPSAYSEYVVWGVGILEILCAALLLFGFGTRIAGLLVAAVSAAMLAMYYWGPFNPFTEDLGFSGEFYLLLGIAALVLTFLGSGRWGLDANIRISRQKAKDSEDE